MHNGDDAVNLSFPCCTTRARGAGAGKRRYLEFGGWAVPGTLLVLLPKCPACLAAYVAVWTGLGLSFSTATHLRTAVFLLCIATLLGLGVNRLRQFFGRGLSVEPNV